MSLASCMSLREISWGISQAHESIDPLDSILSSITTSRLVEITFYKRYGMLRIEINELAQRGVKAGKELRWLTEGTMIRSVEVLEVIFNRLLPVECSGGGRIRRVSAGIL